MRILKFGGKSLSSTEKIDSIAQKISKQIKENNNEKLIVVVSAMGNTTSELLNLASQVNSGNPKQESNRELDMLLASGERVSAALLSLALQKYDIPSISFTGSQAGILTKGKHNDSTIKEIKPHRIDGALQKGLTPVIAGFQGVDPETKDVTTLGRGGSDLTACAFANHYKCTAELYKTVGGVKTCDPNIYPKANLIEELDYNFLQALSSWGGSILHDKASDFIKEHQTTVCFLSDESFKPLTYIKNHTTKQSFSIACLDHVIAIKVNNKQIPEALSFLNENFSSLQFKILASAYNDEDSRFLIQTNEAHKTNFIDSDKIDTLDDSLIAVSAVFSEPQENSFLAETVSNLNGFEIKRFLETDKRLTFFVNQTKKMELVSKLHSILS